MSRSLDMRRGATEGAGKMHEAGIVALLRENGPMTVRGVADYYHVDERTVTSFMDGLALGGWVEVAYRVREKRL